MSVSSIEETPVGPPPVWFNPTGLPEVDAAKTLKVRPGEIVSLLMKEIQTLVEELAACSSVESFRKKRRAIFPSFVGLLSAMSYLMLSFKVNAKKYAQLAEKGMKKLEAEFVRKGPKIFGEEEMKEALFLVSTLHRAIRLIPRIIAAEPDQEKKEEDVKIARLFFENHARTQLHLLAMRSAFTHKRKVNPAVAAELLEGLRASVMVYSCARQALDLRKILDARYAEKPHVSWDEEDEALAHS